MLYVFAIFSIIAIIAAYAVYKRSQLLPRDASMRVSGEAVDLIFTDKDNSILERLKFFKIYDTMTLQVAAHNVLRSKTRPPDIWVFDYRAIVGLRKASGKVEQTVFYFSDPRMKLPGFRIIPKQSEFGRQSDQVFKYRPVIFPSSSLFMSHYRLIGPDEHEIRELFKPDLLGYFEKIKGLCVEGFGNEMIIYQHKTLINDKLFPRFYQNAQSIFQLFLHHSALSSAEKTGLTVYS